MMTTPLAVLIVEDSESDAKLIVRSLDKAGYKVTSQVVETAAQMRAALDDAIWDIIVSDYSLPQFNGHAALMLAQETGSDIPFIVVSGVIGEEAAVAMMKSGANDYVMKDNIARLVPAVEREMRDASTRRARSRAEQALWKERWRLESIIEGTHVGTWEWNVQTGEMILNEIWAQMVGYTLRELAPMSIKTWERVIHPDDRKQSSELLERHFTGELPYYDYVCRIKHKDGHYVWVQYRGCVSIRTNDGKPLTMFGTQTDITSRKRAEEELQKLQKLQSVGTLAGVIACDFSDILTGVLANISQAKDEFPKEHSGQKLLDAAEESMNRAVLLTKRLMTFAKGVDPVKEEVGLGALVEEVARFGLSGSKARLECQKVEGLWTAEVDKGQIQQVVSTLVVNAREAMPDGGCLYVTLENADIPAEAIPSLPQGKYVKVTVRDEGIGIDKKNLDRIFELYFTTKKSGSGLGLATAYSIVNRHGGHIGVVSALGKGTTFTLYLPATVSPRRTGSKQ